MRNKKKDAQRDERLKKEKEDEFNLDFLDIDKTKTNKKKLMIEHKTKQN